MAVTADQTPGDIQRPKEGQGSLVALSLLALVVGAAAGLVGALFRLALTAADNLRNALVVWAHGEHASGVLLVIAVCAAATATAAWLVRRWSPNALGSGIPQVEAMLHGELTPPPFPLVPVKFLGGLLAIGAGLALGREGPSVQMAANMAHFVGRLYRRTWPDRRVLVAAGAGAGLATAFNAPLAGAIFVLEELVQRFERRIAIAALAASATAIGVARVLLGDAPDFHVHALAYATAPSRPLYFMLGAIAGVLGIVYNRTLLATLKAAARRRRWPGELRAGLIGGAVGMLAFFAPALVGGGDSITQGALDGAAVVALLPLVFLLRFGLGAASYAAATPGGLFAPILVLGAQMGLLFGVLCRTVFPDLNIQPEGFAVVGMAALFTGIVRAPLTGMVLVTEMTADTTMLLPMLGACFVAMVVPALLRDPPIYDSLTERTLRREKTPGAPAHDERT